MFLIFLIFSVPEANEYSFMSVEYDMIIKWRINHNMIIKRKIKYIQNTIKDFLQVLELQFN